MKPLAVSAAACALAIALQAQSAPWRPRPVIVIDPRAVLASPTPHAKPRPHRTPPRPRRTPAGPRPDVFVRYETAPSPAPSPRTRTRNA